MSLFTGGLHSSAHGKHWDISHHISIRHKRWEWKNYILKLFLVSPLESSVPPFAIILEWMCCCICSKVFDPSFVCTFFVTRCEHGDAGSASTVGGRPELRPWHRSRCWKLLWSSWVYGPYLFSICSSHLTTPVCNLTVFSSKIFINKNTI